MVSDPRLAKGASEAAHLRRAMTDSARTMYRIIQKGLGDRCDNQRRRSGKSTAGSANQAARADSSAFKARFVEQLSAAGRRGNIAQRHDRCGKDRSSSFTRACGNDFARGGNHLAAVGFTAADLTAYRKRNIELFDIASRVFTARGSSAEQMLMADTVSRFWLDNLRTVTRNASQHRRSLIRKSGAEAGLG